MKDRIKMSKVKSFIKQDDYSYGIKTVLSHRKKGFEVKKLKRENIKRKM